MSDARDTLMTGDVGNMLEGWPLDRYETLDWGCDPLLRGGTRSLGSLRRFMREIADWPDSALVECSRLGARRRLPLTTAEES